MDRFGRARGLHRPCSTSAPSDKLLHGGYARVLLLVTSHGRTDVALTFATNTIVFFEEAIEEARRLDAEFAESGHLKGPLHGVPISLKDLCAFFSLCSGRGYVRYGVLMARGIRSNDF